MKDPKLAEDIRGFIGQEAIHADVHEQALHEFMAEQGFDLKPMLDQVEYVFAKVLGPSTSRIPSGGTTTSAIDCGSSPRSSTTPRCSATSR